MDQAFETKEIECDKKVIKDIFNFWFRVPNYQRPYVWNTDQVKTLFEDVFDAYKRNEDAQYFLGSLVLKVNHRKQEGGLKYLEYEILDGQQRLTTLLLFFAVLRDIVDGNDESYGHEIKKACSPKVFQKRSDLENIPERMRIVFDIRAEVKEFVNQFIKTDGGTTNEDEFKKNKDAKGVNVSIRNMSNAILTIRDFLNGFSEEELYAYFKFLLNKVLLVYVATEQLEDAFQLFTVLNNRGVKLNNSDILKTTNLRELDNDNARRFWSEKWEEMEKHFGDDFDKFLSNIRTIIVKRKALFNLLKEFEEIYNDRNEHLLTKGKQTFEFVYRYYNVYKQIFDEDQYDAASDYEISNYLKFMRLGLETDYWVAPVMSYYDKFGKKGFLEFLKTLDKKISADWIISLSPSKRIENVNKILIKIESAGTPEELLCSEVFDISIVDFERVMAMDLYGKRYARYILLKLDLLYLSKSTRFNPPVTITIEHILPQNPVPDSQWCKDFTDDQRAEWVDKLGNLILLSRKKNASQGNKDFALKRDSYFKNNVEVFPSSVRVFENYKTWTADDILAHHEEVMEKLLMQYRN